jgi:hypothetical protein
MGVRYFAQFPSTFVERIEELKDCGVNNDFEGMKYTVLVYIAINQRENNFVSVAKNDIQFKTEKGTHQRKTDHSVTFKTLIDVIFNIFYVVFL